MAKIYNPHFLTGTVGEILACKEEKKVQTRLQNRIMRTKSIEGFAY
jgi:hypothetical protein